MPVRCAEPDRSRPVRARSWLLAACAACLVACTGPGLEPPDGEGNSVLPPDLSGPAAGGADRADAGAPTVQPPTSGSDEDPIEIPTVDAGAESDADAGDDPDLDAGTP
jgi:hypothetical protein